MSATESEKHARLVEEMITAAPWKDRAWARVALAIAARAIRRGRHLTDSEKVANLADALETDDVDGSLQPFIAKLRSMTDSGKLPAQPLTPNSGPCPKI